MGIKWVKVNFVKATRKKNHSKAFLKPASLTESSRNDVDVALLVEGAPNFLFLVGVSSEKGFARLACLKCWWHE
jgi:hypothetical protein